MEINLENWFQKKLEESDPYKNFEILEQTDDFIVINKKNGLPVQVTDTDAVDLETILKEQYGDNIFVLNRIDQPVSGIVIFGRSKTFTKAFTDMMIERNVSKTYLAIVSGEPYKEPTELKHFTKKYKSRAIIADVLQDEYFKEALLTYTWLQSFDNYHLLRIDLKTGRYHQIRAQLSAVGLPVKGDLKYGSKRPNMNRSIGLLSYKYEFTHPFTQKKYSYIADLPDNDVIWSFVDKTLL